MLGPNACHCLEASNCGDGIQMAAGHGGEVKNSEEVFQRAFKGNLIGKEFLWSK